MNSLNYQMNSMIDSMKYEANSIFIEMNILLHICQYHNE